jgi:hypothetical protein
LRKEAENKAGDQKGKNNDKTRVAIVGRVSGPGFDAAENSRIQAQMRLLEDGYFSAPVRVGSPVGFRLHGFLPLDYWPQGSEGPVEYAGELKLRRTPDNQKGSLRGKVNLEGGANPTQARLRIFLSDMVENINWCDNTGGFEGSRGLSVDGKFSPDGGFHFAGLSPMGYSFGLSAEGYVSDYRSIRFEPGEAKSLEPITLFRKRTGQIHYVVSPNGDFTSAPLQSGKIVFDGSGWKATGGLVPPKYGNDFFQRQYGDTAVLDFFYAPVFVVRLGGGKVADFRAVTIKNIEFDQPRYMTFREDEVYLMSQRHWKQWILLSFTDLK